MQWTPCQLRATLRSHVLLVGMPAAGKTALGKVLALQLGLPFVDLDSAIGADAGQPVPVLLRQEGEQAFRIREAAVLREMLAGESPIVLATGGGTPCFLDGMQELLQAGTVLWLDATTATLTDRVLTGDTERPLLGQTRQDVAQRLEDLTNERQATYAQADFRLDANRPAKEVLAEALRALGSLQRLPAVAEDGKETPVFLHSGDIAHAASALSQLAGVGRRVALVVDAQVKQQAEPLLATLRLLGHDPAWLVLPGGERCKDVRTLTKVWQWLGGIGIGRDDLLVGVGGGAITDLAGLAAATWLRGIRVAQVPTTLLAMADASVGGKTAIDLELPVASGQDTGGQIKAVTMAKNMVGAFHPPSLVWLPLHSLHTLPLRQWRAGLAEIAKMLLLFDPAGWQAMQRDARAIRQRDLTATAPLLQLAVAHKARIVALDPRETVSAGTTPQRAMLNLGHTLAHALEADAARTGYTLLHGEAVALGLCAAAAWSQAGGRAPAGLASAVRNGLAAVDLPTDWAARTSAAVLDATRSDKKRRGADLFEVALLSVGQAEVVRTDLAEWVATCASLAANDPFAASQQGTGRPEAAVAATAVPNTRTAYQQESRSGYQDSRTGDQPAPAHRTGDAVTRWRTAGRKTGGMG
jgi:shikimate kinase/3-dehydroquinate synthase